MSTEYACPVCGSPGVVISNAAIRCTQCGQSACLTGATRAQVLVPSEWIQRKVVQDV